MPKRKTILVLAPTGRDEELLIAALAKAGLEGEHAGSFSRLLEAARTGEAGALLITSEVFTPDRIEDLAATLAHQPHWSDLPMLVLVPGGAESKAISHLEKLLRTLPNLSLLERPIRPATLASVARNALNSRTRQLQVKDIFEEKEQAAFSLIESEKLVAVGRLASSIAHEINNPLEAVTNLLYLLRGEAGLSQAGQELLDTADRELARVSQITSQALRFHRQSTAATSVRPDVLLEEVLEIYHTRLLDSNIEVKRDFCPEAKLTCYESDVRQVLSNLIDNAFDVMRQGGCLWLRTRVASRWSTGRPGVMITICDNGPGMSEVVQKRAFEAFYSTKGIHGTGLGLWIARRIASKHEGFLHLRSQTKEQTGSVFQLWLPSALADSANESWHNALI